MTVVDSEIVRSVSQNHDRMKIVKTENRAVQASQTSCECKNRKTVKERFFIGKQ